KTLQQVSGELRLPGQPPVPASGYEIHAGISSPATDEPAPLTDIGCGWLSNDGQILGTYWHGILDTAQALSAILHWGGGDAVETPDIETIREQQIERLAD